MSVEVSNGTLNSLATFDVNCPPPDLETNMTNVSDASISPKRPTITRGLVISRLLTVADFGSGSCGMGLPENIRIRVECILVRKLRQPIAWTHHKTEIFK